MRTHTRTSQQQLTPELALNYLRSGNQRFVDNLKANRNLLQQVNETSDGQYPFATILSCIDSRTSAELIFDQGLGDVFSIRIAGNFLNDDILGSMEFACKVAGSKLIVVLGHTRCGAIKGACDDVKLGYLTGLLKKLRPAVDATLGSGDRSSENSEFVESVAKTNVHLTVEAILARSAVLRTLYEQGEVGVCGGIYNVQTGAVEFSDLLLHQTQPRTQRTQGVGTLASAD